MTKGIDKSKKTNDELGTYFNRNGPGRVSVLLNSCSVWDSWVCGGGGNGDASVGHHLRGRRFMRASRSSDLRVVVASP